MYLKSKNNTVKILSVILIFALLEYVAGTSFADSSGGRAVKYIDSISGYSDSFISELLAPPSMFSPLYALERDAAGKLTITEPPAQYKDRLYTEVVLAFLAHSVDNDVGDGPFEAFMEKISGGMDLEKCRIGHVKRIGSAYHALYKVSDPENPRILFLRFSGHEPGARVEKGRGAVIRLLDGTEILVEIDYLSTGELPRKYTIEEKEELIMIHEVSEVVINGGKPKRATDMVFTGAAFQDRNTDVFVSICDRLLAAYAENRGEKSAIKGFLAEMISDAAEFSERIEVSRSVQLIAGQALTIISWMDRKIAGANGVRLTTDVERMAANDKRGISFIDRTTLPEGIAEVKEDGAPGFYWRGTEEINKLGTDRPDRLIFDRRAFEAAKDNVVLYLMDHGFQAVSPVLLEMTEKGNISTLHETAFLNDFLPGSFQATSTGAGHFQGTKVDIKNVTAGRGIQVNVRYNADGTIAEVIAQEIKEGQWTLALPGYVDYMINLGGLRFNDISVDLSPELAGKFSPDFDFSPENIKAVEAAIAEKGKSAPYLAARIGDEAYLIKNRTEAPEPVWISMPKGYSEGVVLTDLYTVMNPEVLAESIPELAYAHRISVSKPVKPPLEMLSDEKLSTAEKRPAPSLGHIDDVLSLIDLNAGFMATLLGPEAKTDVLIRIPIEALDAVGAENVKDYLAAIQDTAHGFIELFSATQTGQVSDDKYAEYGIKKKVLPKDFKRGKENTVTLFTVLKAEEISAKGRADGEWGIGDVRPTDTIISPIGLNYDKTGFVRSIILGLRLSEIARQKAEKGEADPEFVKQTFVQYRYFCFSQGVRNFNLSEDDLINLATGNINKMVEALNRIIKVLPIRPVNTEELRAIYEHAREALIRA